MNPYLSTIGYQGPNILLAIIIVNLAWQHNTNPTIYLAVVGWQIASHLLNVVIIIIVLTWLVSWERYGKKR